MLRYPPLSVAALAYAVCVFGCGSPPPDSDTPSPAAAGVHRTEQHMGTLVTVRLDGIAYDPAQPILDRAFAEIKTVDERFSNYKSESELSRLNATAAQGPRALSAEMTWLLNESIAWGKRTDGTFDCTVGPLVRTWGFFKREGRIPEPAELTVAMRTVGWNHLLFDTANAALAFDAEGVELDFGGVAKGYAVDKADAALREAGVTSALVDASGNFAAIGTPGDGRPHWTIGIRHPFEHNAILATVEFHEEGIATSGGYENYFEAQGKRYVHILDPRTGFPVDGMLSTTVIAPTAMEADILSTATFVLGVKRSLALIESLPDTECVLVSGDSNVPDSMRIFLSSGAGDRVEMLVDAPVEGA